MEMTVSCIIVEDEPLARERMQEFVGKVPFLSLKESFDNAIDAHSFLKSNPTDLIFLDINLGELSGIQLLESSKIESQVIITTAYHQYALKGYELSVTDYLLKPFTFERFLQAVDKVKVSAAKKPEPERKFIFIKTENRLEKVNFADVLFIEGMRDYRRIHTVTKKIMTLTNFSELEKEIPRHIICRVHKSYMVAIDKIEKIERDEIKVGNIAIPISGSYKAALLQIIGQK